MDSALKESAVRENRKRFLTGLTTILLVLFFYSGSYAADSQKNFLWKVRSKTGTVYMLGSIHYFKKEYYPLNKKIDDAFSESSSLVVEADINNPDKIDIRKLLVTAFYGGGDSLENHVSKETYDLLKKEMLLFGIPPELLNRQRPWFIALTVTASELIRLGYSPAHGIDVYFLSKAADKKILELESMDYQIALFSGLSDKEQEAMLLSALKETKTLNRKVNQIVGAWKSGDAKTMESILAEDMKEDNGMSGIYEKLLYARNKEMTARIEDFLKTGDKYFVVVGAGHLVGSKGILELLRAKGYAIEQL